MNNGLFVTFEGIDYSGKSVQAKLLYEACRGKNRCLLLRDPGATEISEKIRTILLDKTNSEMSPWTELLLYEAARSQLVSEKILPEMALGGIVICDRFYDSTTAYQGYARGLDLAAVERANILGSCGLMPGITFLLDVEPKRALMRKKVSDCDDRLEAEGMGFQNKVRQGYLDIARKEAERIVVIDGHGRVDSIHKNICRIMNERFYNEITKV
ncbi:dTMP kinase [candidate division KSB1 bacterium]|nr:dTMP kinase [candidate division KSB1 bacterium]